MRTIPEHTCRPTDIFLINSHAVHETRCPWGTRYVCIHILPSAMCRYAANIDQLNFYLNQIRAIAVCRELYGCTPSEKRKAFREMIADGVY